MKNLFTRLAPACLALCLCLALPVLADGPDTPVIVFNQADGVVIHKSDLTPYTPVPIAIHITDGAGVASATLSGGYASGSGHFPAGTTSADEKIGFFGSYFPDGDYAFRATATNDLGVQAQKTIIVHLVD